MPELTVILPARNAEQTVRGAVTSTLKALPKDAELVVLDDGSTDGTSEILQAVRDRRLRVINGAGSGGVAPALNTLLEKTDSRLVARMDADDICLPWRFHTTLPAFEQGVDVVFSPVIELHGKRLAPGLLMPIPPEIFGLHLLLSNPVSHPTMIARRSSLEEAGGYRHVPSEDYDLWLRLVAAGAGLRRVTWWGLLYRIHDSQITASIKWRTRSWTSPEQAEAFADASEQIVGQRLSRLVQIPEMPSGQARAALSEFERAVAPVIARIPGMQGGFLRSKLRKRLRWVEDNLGPAGQLIGPQGGLK